MTIEKLNPNSYLDPADKLKVYHHPQLVKEAEFLEKSFKNSFDEPHALILSSGTSGGGIKGYALSYRALKANAQAVNAFYSLSETDRWGLSLPTYHVGGLSVMVRAKLSQSEVIDCRGWNPGEWYKKIDEAKITITTVVPTQVFDLVTLNLKAPNSLRFMIVGGDFLSSELEKKARELGWPIIRTYGMSEVCSQLASGRAPGEPMQVLPIHQVKSGPNERLLVKSQALFTLQFQLRPNLIIQPASELCDSEGFYLTQDRVSILGNHIQPLGRIDQQLKVAGHLVDLPSLRDKLYTELLRLELYGKAEVAIEEDERKGKKLVLIHQSIPQNILDALVEALAPVPVDEVRVIQDFERTDLGKLKSSQSMSKK